MSIQRPRADIFGIDPSTFDVEPMSRPDPVSAASLRGRLATMSYPQRIAAILAQAPKAPPLRRGEPAAPQPMSEMTRARLIMIHAVQATYGGPTAPKQVH